MHLSVLEYFYKPSKRNKDSTNIEDWYPVPGKINPADIASMGYNAKHSVLKKIFRMRQEISQFHIAC